MNPTKMRTLTGDIKLLFKPGTKLQKTGGPAQDGSPFKHKAPSSGAPRPGPRSPLLSRVQGRRLAPGVPAWGVGPPPRPSGLASPSVSLSPPLPTLLHFFGFVLQLSLPLGSPSFRAARPHHLRLPELRERYLLAFFSSSAVNLVLD